MNKLVARSLEIIRESTKEVGKDYFSNINTLIDDAKEVRNSITKVSTDAADTFSKLKRTSITKKISDWFYNEENSADAESTGDEEFDPGFKTDESTEEDKTPSEPLTEDSMEKISKKQNSTLLKIGRRQTEQSVMNTAEIVSAFNSRSSEIITAMNNINKSITGISEKLDKIIKIQTVGFQEEKEEERQVDKRSLFDSDGKLSLARIFEMGKTSIAESQAVGGAKMFLNQFLTGETGPADLLADGIKKAFEHIKIGDKTIDSIGKSINDTVGAATQTLMAELIKSGPGKFLFGDMTKLNSGKDYGELVPDNYNNKRAQFDNITRKTIVQIIPEMLAKINESVSGVKYHITDKGEWSSKAVKDDFVEVTHEAFNSIGVSSSFISKTTAQISKDLNIKISDEDVRLATSTLKMVIVAHKNDIDDQLFVLSELNGDASSYISMAVPILLSIDKGKRDATYWATVCQSIIIQLTNGLLDSSAFISDVNKSFKNMHTRAADFAQSGKMNAKQARQITGAMIKQQFILEHTDKKEEEEDESTTSNTDNSSDTTNTNNDSNKGKKKKKNKDKSATIDGRLKYADSIKRGKYDTIDYLHGIFGILNRGINVKIDNEGGKKYKNYSLDRKNTTQENTDDSMGKIISSTLTGGEKEGENALKNAVVSGINNALTGYANGAGKNNANSSGSSLVLSSLISSIGFGGSRAFFDKFLSGEGGNTLKNIKNKASDLIHGRISISEATSGIREALPDSLRHDSRVARVQNAVNAAPEKAKGLFSRAKDKVKDTFNSFIGKNETAEKYTNNAIYAKDSASMKLASDYMKNIDASSYNKRDARRVEIIQKMYENGEYSGDKLNRAVAGITDENLKKRIESSVKTTRDVTEKRKAGEAAIAAGQKAELGAVMTTDKTGFESKVQSKVSSIASSVKSGFGRVGGLLGKIASAVIKIAKSGLIDIKYGLQSMKEGMFGYKDENGNKHKGLFQQAFTPLTATYGFIKNKAEKFNESGGIKNMQFSRFTGNATVGDVLNKVGSKVVSRERYNDQTGEKIAEQVQLADFIKKPGQALSNSLKNLTYSISHSGLAKALKKVVGAVSGFAKKLNNGATNLFKKLSFGQGFMKGFDRAKEAKAKAQAIEEEKKYRKEHPTEANIEDALVTNTDSFLGKIHSKFDDLLALLKQNHDEDMDAAETAEENADKRAEESKSEAEESGENKTQTDGATNVQSSSEEGEEKGGLLSRVTGKIKNFFGRKKKNDDDEEQTEQTTESSESPKESTVQGSPDIGAVNQTSTVNPQPTPDGGGGGSPGGLKGLVGGIKSVLGNIGQIAGGMLQSIMGVTKVVLAALSSLSALSAIKEMITSIWSDGIKPLNKAFYMLKKQLQPIVYALKRSLQTIMKSVSSMLSVLFESIKPIMEIIQPILETIMSILKPMLSIVEAGLGVVLSTIGDILIKVAPAIEIIADAVQFLSGGLMWGMGTIINIVGGVESAMGSVITGVGYVIKVLTLGLLGDGVIKVGSGYKSLGDKLGKTGDGLQDSAREMMSGALSNLATHFYELIQPIDERKEALSEGYAPKVDTSQVKQRDEMGAGDVNTNTVNNSWTYMYGSGNSPSYNQHSYSSIMNMGERGCGPVALADAYTRRTGNRINPVDLARGMAGSGNYDPRRGSSVGSMMNAGSSLGIGMRLGGVTQSSLNQASPSNPITLLGSGAGFGTKKGHNHYVNVIGTDAMGGAYVSNPMSGRVERTSRSQLALNAKLGLYGSGDADYDMADMYGLDYTVTDKLKALKQFGERLTAIFTGDSAAVAAEKKIKAAQNETKAKAIRDKLGDDYAEIEEKAKEELKKNYPKRDGEDEDAYQKRLDKLWSDKWATYVIQAGSEAADLKNRSMIEELTSGVNSAQEGVRDVSSGISRQNDGSTAFVGAVMAEFSPVNNYQTDIYGEDSDRSPVHDFFSATSGYHSHTKNGGWFNKVNDPDKYGQGKKGNKHEGVSIWFDTDEYEDEPEVHAITHGTAVYVGRNGGIGNKDINGGLGNHVKFIDDSGMYHWFLHLNDIDDSIQEGSNIEPNQLIGHVGNTGATGFDEEGRPNKFLRYILTRSGPYGSTGDKGYENPFKYWDWYEPFDVPGSSGTIAAAGSASGPIISTADESEEETTEEQATVETSADESAESSSSSNKSSSLSAVAQNYIKATNVSEASHPSQWKNLSASGRNSIYSSLANYHKKLCDKNGNYYHDTYCKTYKSRILNGHDASSTAYWKYGYEMTIKARDGQSIQSFVKHHSDLMNAWNFVKDQGKVKTALSSAKTLNGVVHYGIGGPNDTKGMKYLSSSGEIPLSAEMSRAYDAWTPYEDKLSSSGYWEKAAKAGMTAGQQAMMAAIGIHEDSAQKLVGEKSLTRITYDKNGQAAVGLMNWIPKNPSGGEDTSFGTTLEEQLKNVVKWYMSSNPEHERARIVNFDHYSLAMKNAMGYEPKLKQGDLWGQYADTDVVESMGHFVGNALIPEDWNLTTGQARHMRTAAMAYNWGLKNGKLSGNQTGTTSAGTANYSGGTIKRAPRFVASMSNYNGGDWITVNGGVGGGTGSASGAVSGSGGFADADKLIQSAIEVADAFNTRNPNAGYQDNWNATLEYRDGTTEGGFRDDCSGYTGRVINHLGYGMNTDGTGNVEIGNVTGQQPGAHFLYDKNGKISNDWTLLAYDKSKVQRGDILYRGIWPHDHTDIFVTDKVKPGTWHTSIGFNMGNTEDMQKIMKVSKEYLDNGGNIDDMLVEADAGSMPGSYDDITRILRYTPNGMTTTSSGDADYGVGGPVDNLSYFKSKSGVAMAPYGTPKYNETNITGNTSGESPVHDFFGQMNGDQALSYSGNWYKLRNDPDKTGTGRSGDEHSGIDINWSSGSSGKKLFAITGGVVDQVQGGGFNGSGSNGGCGNNVRWLDDAGYLHWYMHMKDDPLVKVGDKIEPGQLLGYAGNTGNSSGAHLHYNINKAEGFNGWSSSNAINPLTYWSDYDSNGTTVDGASNEEGATVGSGTAVDVDALLRTRKLSGIALGAKQRGGFSNASYWNDDIEEYTDNEDEHMTYDEIAEIINSLAPDVSEIYTMAAINSAVMNNVSNKNGSSSSSSSSSRSSSSGSSSSSSSSSSDKESGDKVLEGDSFIDNFINDNMASATEKALMAYAKQQTKSSKEKDEEAQIETIKANNKVGSASAAVQATRALANRTPSMPFNIFDPYAYKIQTPDNRTKAFNELDNRFDIVRGWGKKYSDGPNVTYSGKNIPGIYHASRTRLNALRKVDGGIQNVKDRLSHDNTLFSSAEDWHYSYLANSSMTHQDRNNHAYDMYDFPDYVNKLKVSYYSGSGDAPSEISTYVPPLDISQLYDNDMNDQASPVVVNNYEISRDNSDNDAILKRMSEMTFNVRAERVEELLEKLITTVENIKQEKNVNTSNTLPNTNLFRDERIPSQISRLARG